MKRADLVASTGNILNVRQVCLLIAFFTVAVALAACGSGDNAGSGVVIVTARPDSISGAGQGVIGAINPTPGTVVASSPTPISTGQIVGSPTPTPPSRTTDEEEGTARLVDELSSDDYPRTSARTLEREFRSEFDTAKEKIGKAFVVQGDVLEAGKDASDQPFVHFKAGAGRVTCLFEVITDTELLRFTPNGANAVVGTIDAWNPEDRVLMIRDCRVVLGY